MRYHSGRSFLVSSVNYKYSTSNISSNRRIFFILCIICSCLSRVISQQGEGGNKTIVQNANHVFENNNNNLSDISRRIKKKKTNETDTTDELDITTNEDVGPVENPDETVTKDVEGVNITTTTTTVEPTITKTEITTQPPTAAPVNNEKTTSPPTVAPTSKKEETTAPPTLSPTPAPTGKKDEKAVETTNPPTVAPITPKPVIAETPSPTKSPIEDVDDNKKCDLASSCSSCKELADSMKGNNMICWWNKESDVCEDVSKDLHTSGTENMCGSTSTSTTTSTSNLYDDDEEIGMGTMIVGFIAVLILVIYAVRKFMEGVAGPAGSSAGGGAVNSHSHGKYQGISTKEDDEDEEWGWDDDAKSGGNSSGGGVEMSKFGRTGSSGSSSLHYRSKSPHSSPKPSSPDVHKPARAGLSVKRLGGLKNPLHPPSLQHHQQPAKIQQQPAVVAPHRPMVAPIAQKPKPAAVAPAPPPPPPRQDDLFEQMGFTAKPKFNKPGGGGGGGGGVTKLGATSLAATADDFGGDDWADDGDLDDLLND